MLYPVLPYFSGAAGVGSTAVLVNAAARRLHGVHVTNINTADSFIQIFDAAAAADVTVGTTAPKQSYLIPGSDGTNRTGFDKDLGMAPILLSNGLVIAVTTTHAGSGNPITSPIVNLQYS